MIDAPKAIDELRTISSAKAPHCSLLRIYWYDGAIGGSRPTTDQASLANLDDVKLRLGFVNNSGQQKGVDSLIVTDLIELARLKSISDAVLLSGDEDVRVGVQIAQNYGVRVHLLGIAPSRGSQSHQLLQEADTTSEWDSAVIAAFLAIRDTGTAQRLRVATPTVALKPSANNIAESEIEATVEAFVVALTETDMQGVVAYWQNARGVPADFDRKLLAKCRDAIGRNLENDETKKMRSCFQKIVKKRLCGQS